MKTRHRSKLVHEGNYVAEVDVELIETDDEWSPYLSLEEASKLDDVRDLKIPSFEELKPQIQQRLQQQSIQEYIADLRSKRASLRTIADLLGQLGVEVSHNTVARFCTEVLNAKPSRHLSRERRRKFPNAACDISSVLKQQREKVITQPSPVPAPSERRGPRIADPKNV